MMPKRIVFAALLLSLVLIFVACSGPATTPTNSTKATAPQTPQVVTPSTTVVVPPVPTPPSNPKPPGPIKERWIEPKVSGDIVSLPVSEVMNSWNTAFKIVNQGKTLHFMAYVLNGEIHVRGNVCPPCRSIGYSLDNDILVCDTCGTTFKAKTGAGVKGPCVNYPKAAVQYKIVGGNIIMDEADLVNAYQETLKAG